jgi:hypothetical protein
MEGGSSATRRHAFNEESDVSITPQWTENPSAGGERASNFAMYVRGLFIVGHGCLNDFDSSVFAVRDVLNADKVSRPNKENTPWATHIVNAWDRCTPSQLTFGSSRTCKTFANSEPMRAPLGNGLHNISIENSSMFGIAAYHPTAT